MANNTIGNAESTEKDVHSNVVEFTSLMHNHNASFKNENDEDILEFTSFAQKRAPIEMRLAEEYANKKGLPVKIINKDGMLTEGRLVDWQNDGAFRVVWKENDMILMDTFKSKDLYEIPENSRLKGAVEFCRIHADEVRTERSQISNMLSSINEPGKLAA